MIYLIYLLISGGNMKRIFGILACAALVFAAASCGTTSAAKNAGQNEAKYVEPVLPSTEMTVLDDLSDGNYWQAVGDSWDKWGTHNLSLSVELSDTVFKGWPTIGTQSLDCVMEAAPASSSKQACWFCDSLANTDWTGTKYVAMDIYNPEKFEFALSFVIQATNAWTWCQSDTVKVPSGRHMVLFDVSKFGDSNLADVKRAIFQSINENPGGHFYAGNIRLYK
jgi:hypothetical protein